jgi:hypothetical protein
MKYIIRAILLSWCLCTSFMACAGFDEWGVAYNRGYATGLKDWLPVPPPGNAAAQYKIGFMNFLGQGIEKPNQVPAEKLHSKTAEQKDIAAQNTQKSGTAAKEALSRKAKEKSKQDLTEAARMKTEAVTKAARVKSEAVSEGARTKSKAVAEAAKAKDEAVRPAITGK